MTGSHLLTSYFIKCQSIRHKTNHDLNQAPVLGSEPKAKIEVKRNSNKSSLHVARQSRPFRRCFNFCAWRHRKAFTLRPETQKFSGGTQIFSPHYCRLAVRVNSLATTTARTHVPLHGALCCTNRVLPVPFSAKRSVSAVAFLVPLHS